MSLASETEIRPADEAAIAAAAKLLRAGGLVAFPTETVYGLGADAGNGRAVAGIFEAKGRPRFNPLIVHLADQAAAARTVRFDARARQVAERFWPGPLTLVLPRTADCPIDLLCSAGLDSLAVRVPDHPVASALLRASGCPLAAPSANRSGRISPSRAAHVAQSLGGRIPLILDGGPCAVGLESTVLDLCASRPRLLRPGAVTREALEALLGPLDDAPTGEAPRAPGQLTSHYAPDLPLVLACREPTPDQTLLAFGPAVPPGAAATLNLSPSGDLTEAAANLFAFLRQLDQPDCAAIAVMPIPHHGLGAAINDRLQRAAAPRNAN